jgi:hypothetical protein
MTIGLIVTAAVLAPLAFMVWLVSTAPEGYEDADGFHYIEHSDYDGDSQ